MEWFNFLVFLFGIIAILYAESKKTKREVGEFRNNIYPKHNNLPEKLVWIIWKRNKLHYIEKYKYVGVFRMPAHSTIVVVGSDDLDSLATIGGRRDLLYLIRDKEFVEATKSIAHRIAVKD